MAQTATMQSSRELVLERRRAMSTVGKAALVSNSAQTTATANNKATGPVAAAPVSTTSGAALTSRAASMSRRVAMSNGGKAAIQSKDRTRADNSDHARVTAPATQPPSAAMRGGDGARNESKTQSAAPIAKFDTSNRLANMPVARVASLARRQAMSQGGKAALNADNNSVNPQPVATAQPVAKSGGEKISRPCGRRRPGKTGAAQEAPWKVGASETTHGQIVTGTMTGRSKRVTGDEPSTCRAITGTEYLGADAARNFCQTQPAPAPSKVAVNTTSSGNPVSGNKIGQGQNMTGNEPGGCQRVTGNEYIGSGDAHTFCGGDPVEPALNKITGSQTRKGKALTGDNVGRSDKVTGDEHGAERDPTGTQYSAPGTGNAPKKVGMSDTLRGGGITGTMVGRGKRVTGDEPGSCKDITGDEYIGQDQYNGFCKTMPRPTDRKSGVSTTLTGQFVTGTLTGRSGRVTGDEPGGCKTLTGTPYASADQFEVFCDPEQAAVASARRRRLHSTPGMPMTGLQPGINGAMTGAQKGACEPVSGTPYVGADQYAAFCPATATGVASQDLVDGVPGKQFSVSSPSGGAQLMLGPEGVTGSRYESGHITGSFGKGEGKLTGTEEARFDRQAVEAAPIVTTKQIQGREKSRISGEGMDTGLSITGDDWDRGKHVTGTEGMSATKRNPTRREGSMTAMAVSQKRNETMTIPESKVTGGSGNTEKGSLITYSGGARG